ncbi:MAG: thiol peroxidase, partial [Gammaproteobacteria bacterium]
STAVKDHPQAVFLMVSADLPFAMSRFCKAEGTENVNSLSLMRSRDFARDYGVLIEDGPLAGITARAVIVLDAADKVIYTQLVPEIAHEPDYDLALAALRG